MDDAQRAERRGLGGKSHFSDDGPKHGRNENRSWFHIFGFRSGLVKLYVKKWQISHCITNPQKSTNRYQILVHSVVPCGLLLNHRRVVSFYKRNESAALQRSFPYLGFIMQIHPPKKHRWEELEERWPETLKVHKQVMVSRSWFRMLGSGWI